MDANLKTAVAKQSKKLAVTTAKQMAHEPLEMAKNVGKQITGLEISGQSMQKPTAEQSGPPSLNQPDEQKIKERGERVLQALESELKDIRKQKLFDHIQRKIANGQSVNLQSYPELSQDQREALESQMKVFEAQKANAEATGPTLVEPKTKRPRKFLAGMQGQVDKLKRKAEIRMPPTG